MSLAVLESLPEPRLKALLDHFSIIDDHREPWRIAHPLPEVLLLVVRGTICDCDSYEEIAAWARPTSRSCAAISTTVTGCPAGAG